LRVTRDIKIEAVQATDNETQVLLSTLAELTGMSKDFVKKEIECILEQAGRSSENFNLDDLRFAMMSYLDQIHLEQQTNTTNVSH
jgi:hypothetical protein